MVSSWYSTQLTLRAATVLLGFCRKTIIQQPCTSEKKQLSTPGKGRQRCCCKGSCASGSAVAPGLGQVWKPSRSRVRSNKYNKDCRNVNPRRPSALRACRLLPNSDASLFTSSQALHHVCDLVPHPGPQLSNERKLGRVDPDKHLQGHDVMVPKGHQSAGARGHSAPAPRCLARPGLLWHGSLDTDVESFRVRCIQATGSAFPSRMAKLMVSLCTHISAAICSAGRLIFQPRAQIVA